MSPVEAKGPPFDEPIIIDNPVGPGVRVERVGEHMVNLLPEGDLDYLKKVDLHGKQWTIEDCDPLKYLAVDRLKDGEWQPELTKTELAEDTAVVFTFSNGGQSPVRAMSVECGSDRTLTMDCLEQQGQSFRWKKITNGGRAGLHPKAKGAIHRVQQIDLTTPGGGNVIWRRGAGADHIRITLSSK